MPRILRIINRFNLGGPTYNAAYLTKYLSPEFETLLVGGIRENGEESSEFVATDLGVNPVLLPEMQRSVNPLNDYKAYSRLVEMIKRFKPDIVHTHAAKAGALGRLAAINCGVPVIVHTFHGHVFHSYFNTLKTSVYKHIEKFLAHKSSCIIAVSEKQKHELVNIHAVCRPEKVRVVPLGLDLERFQQSIPDKRSAFRKKYLIDEDEIAIAIVGRLAPVKNHALFLEGIHYLREKSRKKIRAFIVGDGEERQALEIKAKALDLDFTCFGSSAVRASVTFTSWIKEVDHVFAGVDIVALTSLNEGTPVSLIEAQAANKAIVSTRVGGIENIVMDGRTALLSEVRDKAGFCKNLLQLVEDDLGRAQLGSNGWKYVKEKFHHSRLISEVQELYWELLEKSGAIAANTNSKITNI